jgi:hypothetical protein
MKSAARRGWSWSHRTLTALTAPALISCGFGLPSNNQQGGNALCPPQGTPPAHSTAYVSGGCPGWSCDPGWADCGQGACGTDLTRDPKNCGDCGNVCPGTCAMGSCQHIDVLRSDLSLPGPVVVDSTNAYFVDQPDGGTLVESVPLSGGDATQLDAFGNTIVLLAVDDSGLYCAAEGATGPGIQRRAPGAASTVASVGSFGALAAGSGFVWWLSYSPAGADAGGTAALSGDDAGEDAGDAAGVDASEVDANAPIDGGATAMDAGGVPFDPVRTSESDGGMQILTEVHLASPFLVLGHPLAIGSGDAFLASNDSVVVVRGGSSSAETLATDTLPVNEVALDDGFVYWTAQTIAPLIDIQPCFFDSCDQDSGAPAPPPPPPPALRRVPRDGGPVVTLAPAAPVFLTASDGLVWGVEPGQAGDDLVRIDGSGRRTLIAGGLGSIQGVAVDALNVYWTVMLASGGGMLLKTGR